MSAAVTSILYSSSGIPVGVEFPVKLYRGVNSAGVITPPATPLSGVTGLLGIYICEIANISFDAERVERKDQVGGDSDFALVRKATGCSMTIQRASVLTAVALPGDCFEIVVGADQPASTELPYVRFVLDKSGINSNSGSASKQSFDSHIDRQNSSASLVQF